MKCSKEDCKRHVEDSAFKLCVRCRKSNHSGRTARRAAKRLAKIPPDRREDVLRQRLFDLTHKSPLPFSSLCDLMDLAPGKLRELIASCKKEHLSVHVAYDQVGFKPGEPDDRAVATIVAPVIGEVQRVGVISDLHFGSKYHLGDQLTDFIEYAYGLGVREILCPGDNLDGCYRFSRFEQSHHGLDAQAQHMLQGLPRKKGLSYHVIQGNHDYTFTESTGVDVSDYLDALFRRHGRTDLHCYGNRGALVRIRGALVHLWHPGSGRAYARSYHLQKKIESYSSGEKPQILLVGHWHMYCHVFERGVHALACPTFQGGGSAYAKSLHDAPAIGGMVLRWSLTEHGTMRDFGHDLRSYFEREVPSEIRSGSVAK